MNENRNWLNKFFIFLYSPLLKLSLKLRYLVVVAFIATIILAYPVYKKQNWEFMPMMNEQTFMYMPVTPYGLGIDLARELTQKTDKIFRIFSESISGHISCRGRVWLLDESLS